MIPFREIVNGYLEIFLLTWYIMLLPAEIFLCADAFMRRRGKVTAAYKLINLINLTALISAVVLLLDGIFRAEYLGKPRDFPAAVEFVYSLPWAVIAAFAAAETVLLAALIINVKRVFDSTVSFVSLKEGMDSLPEGMGYYTTSNTPVLVNAKMQTISSALTGEGSADPEQLWSKAVGLSKTGEAPLLLPLNENGTFLLSRGETEQFYQRFLHFTGEDISEQYRITDELRKKNAALMHIRRRYTEYSRSMVRHERERSLLNARSDMHSELGHALLLAKSYFSGNTDGSELLTQLDQINKLFISSDVSAAFDLTPCDAAVQKARSIGVDVKIDGSLPESENAAIILARAIDECSANAAKHADASTLNVSLSYSGDKMTARLTHGGAKSGGFSEKGGLLLLRYETESFGGSMKTETAPSSAVIIEIGN